MWLKKMLDAGQIGDRITEMRIYRLDGPSGGNIGRRILDILARMP